MKGYMKIYTIYLLYAAVTFPLLHIFGFLILILRADPEVVRLVILLGQLKGKKERIKTLGMTKQSFDD
jgi:hypothetical protein